MCNSQSGLNSHPSLLVETFPHVDQATVATKYYSVVVNHCFLYAALLFLKWEVNSRDYMEHCFSGVNSRDYMEYFWAHCWEISYHFAVTAVATEQLQELRVTQMEDFHPIKVTGVQPNPTIFVTKVNFWDF